MPLLLPVEKITINSEEAMAIDKITLKNMKFFAYHGVYEKERLEGQNFFIDVEMYLDLRKPGVTDNLEDTINYSDVYKLVQKITQGNSFKLIEKLAESISGEILSTFTRIETVKVRVRKPQAPIGGVLDWAEVEVERSAHGA
ncbi:dihydroneopterin aldolase [Pseudoclostridium thermosuccinogenes]|jgi:dihydroneopterin aldolase|nr:dihydroneopterin aldolase [Pseudoclostridium thermosuccinogenes]